jgi:hypothetical protein
VDADYVAGLLLAASRQQQTEGNLTDSVKVVAFALSGLLALFDPVYLRVFDDFQASDYYHPKVRRGTFFGGMRRVFSEAVLDRVDQSFGEGAGWFEDLMRGLEVDAFTGRFGQVSMDRGSPIVNPLRSLAFQPTYETDVDAAERDLAWAEEKYRSLHGAFYVRWPQD